ncbi:transketolase, C-terminal domain protein, partial [Mycobacterium tuberculosis variant bovis]
PVPEIQFDGFSYPAFDQVVSHLAKYRTRTRGEVDMPVPEIQFDGFSYPAFDQVVSHLAKYRTRTRGEVDMPVPEIQFDGFSYPAFDQVVSHLAKYRTRTRGEVDMPVTVRIPSFGGIGAAEHHSDSTESYWVHTAGLKVVVPSTPGDAYWLLRHAIACPDPVMYLEPKRRYHSRGMVDTSRPEPPIGHAMVRRSGTDVTVVTYGNLVSTALSSADTAEQQHDWSLEVIDLRSLAPLDFDTIAASIQRTGRCVVMHEGPRSLGYGAGLAARIQEEMFYQLESGGYRSAVVGAAGLRHHCCVDPAHRALRGDARRAAQPRLWCRSGRAHPGRDVLPIGGSGVACLRF